GEILNLIFEVAPAERGAILLDGVDPKNFGSVYGRNRIGVDPGSVRVSRTVARQVIEQGVAILGSDVTRDGSFSAVESIIVSQVRSLLCVPLIFFEKVIG